MNTALRIKRMSQWCKEMGIEPPDFPEPPVTPLTRHDIKIIERGFQAHGKVIVLKRDDHDNVRVYTLDSYAALQNNGRRSAAARSKERVYA
jgi:hypothetical protein